MRLQKEENTSYSYKAFPASYAEQAWNSEGDIDTPVAVISSKKNRDEIPLTVSRHEPPPTFQSLGELVTYRMETYARFDFEVFESFHQLYKKQKPP